MERGSLIRSSCGIGSAAGVSRAPLLPTMAGSTLIRPALFKAALSSSSCSQIRASLTATSPCSTSTSPPCDEDPLPEKEEKEEDVKKRVQKGVAYPDLSIFGPSPSKEEAEAAVSALKLVSYHFVGEEEISFFKDAFHQTPLLNEDTNMVTACRLDQSKPWKLACGSKSVFFQAQHKILNALHLLRIDPSVKSIVVSLSSDKAVWNAIMKNEMVQEFRKSYIAEKYMKYAEHASRGSTAGCSNDITAHILNWIFETAKAQVMQFIEDIVTLVNKLFHSESKENNNSMEIVSDVVRSSFMVSVMVFIVVILKRLA